jgi:hypothetical protein
MKQHRLAGDSAELRSPAKRHLGPLPEDGFHELERRRDTLARLIQEQYGVERDEADRLIDQWLTGSVQARG